MYRKGHKLFWEKEDVDFLKENYLHMTNKKIAEKFGIGTTTVGNKAKEIGLPAKNNKNRLEHKYEKPMGKILYYFYHEKKMTYKEMAEEFSVGEKTIYDFMKKHNIKPRSYRKITKNRWNNMTKEQREKQVEAAHKKMKQLSKTGKTPLNKLWNNNYNKMKKHAKRAAYLGSKFRRRNGMKGVTGSDHPNWNPELTPKEREKKRRELYKIDWRGKVLKKDNYTCQICGDNSSGNLVAHHKYSYRAYLDKRTDIDNGVTLCEDCHKKFHDIYGYGDNIEEQFKEFVSQNKGITKQRYCIKEVKLCRL